MGNSCVRERDKNASESVRGEGERACWNARRTSEEKANISHAATSLEQSRINFDVSDGWTNVCMAESSFLLAFTCA